MSDNYKAVRDGAASAALTAYFDARPNPNERIFCDGFVRAYDVREHEIENLRQQLADCQKTLAGEWISVDDALPECDMTPNSFGIQVLVYPPMQDNGCSPMNVAFYGCRQTDEPNFYMFGNVFTPTHWMPLPPAPLSASKEHVTIKYDE